MNLQDFKESVIRTMAELDSPWHDNLHMVLGLVTESGELADAFKKELAYHKEIDWTNVKEELGDLLWYVMGMCIVNGWDLEDILQTNSDKLKARYPEKFDTDFANNRDLKKERKVLEGASTINLVDINSFRFPDQLEFESGEEYLKRVYDIMYSE